MNILSPQLEYIRAKDKDSEILTTIKSKAQSVLRDLIGNQYITEVACLIEILYHLISYSSSSPKQTPGQELTSTSLVDYQEVIKFRRVLVSSNYIKAAKLFSPGLPKIFLYIFVKALTPFLFRKLWNAFKGSSDSRVIKALPDAQEIIEEISRINFAVFLLTGLYDEFSKRVFNLAYLKLIRPRTEALPLKRLGYLVLAQSFFSVFKISKNFFDKINQKKVEENLENQESKGNDCVLCLGDLKNATCTPCGHVFCWSCISSASNLAVCPVCRAGFQQKALLHLRNF